jgi:general secretion pathway protein G
MYTANNQTGVTLIEMVATLAIISILATGILPLSQVVYKRTKEMELRNNLRVIRKALDEHKVLVDEKVISVGPGASGYPESLEILVTGVDLKTATGEKRKFLRRIPKDPMVEDGEWGLRSYADDSDSSIWGGQDVYDVYSQSDKQAIDGSYYREW